MEKRRPGAIRERSDAGPALALILAVLLAGCPPKKTEPEPPPQPAPLTLEQFNSTWRQLLREENFDQARQWCEPRLENEEFEVDALVCLFNLEFLRARSSHLNVDLTAGGLGPDETGEVQITEDNIEQMFREVVVYDQAGIDRALSHLDRALALDPSRPDLWKGKAYALQEAGRHRELMAHLRRMSRECPAVTRADISVYGENYVYHGRHEAALDVYQLCTELYPGDFAAWSDYGAVYSLTGDLERALEIMHHAETLGQDDLLLTNLANLNIYLDRFAEALPYLERVYRRNPDYELDRFRYVFCMMAVDRERAEQTARRLSGPSFPNVNQLAELLEEGFTSEEALAWAEEFFEKGFNELCLIAIALAPTEPRGLYLKAAVYDRIGYPRGEKASLLEFLARAPAHDSLRPEAHFHLGVVLVREEGFAEAEHHLRRALDGGPADSERWFFLGYALMKQGREEEAAEAFDESVRINDKPAAVGLSKRFLKELGDKPEPR